MKRTTLNLDDGVAEAAKRYAAREGTTLTDVVDMALRQFLSRQRQPRRRFKLDLQVHSSSLRPGVDLEDRDNLYELMDGRT